MKSEMDKTKKNTLVIIVFSMFFYGCLYAQSISERYKFPNTNIGKEAFNVYGGAGYMPYSGNLSNFFEPSDGGTLSLSYYTPNSMAYLLSLSGSFSKLKRNLSDIWQKGDSATFYSVEFSAGYSLLNHVRWRVTPFCGLALSASKPRKQTVKEHPELKQFKTGLTLSPALGVNITYKFIKPQRYSDFRGSAGCFALNMRIDYVPFAVHKKNLLYHGGIWYLTMGVCLEIFNAGYF